MTLVFRCDQCGNQTAMLTNPYETQIFGSLGVRVGHDLKTNGEAGKANGGQANGGAAKCPFSRVVTEQLGIEREHVDEGIAWTARAWARLQHIPEFARPMAKTGIEKFARDRGHDQVDEEVLGAAKDFFGM